MGDLVGTWSRRSECSPVAATVALARSRRSGSTASTSLTEVG
ncbi:hypothetical protein [Plantactinospora sp. KLBMP9567]|nr:hypothetical protein [Plantactinospora sp. KLBMP9567]MDW5324663.1 hypothetical protein [Plantactinospora sp. KLBMP9567]